MPTASSKHTILLTDHIESKVKSWAPKFVVVHRRRKPGIQVDNPDW